MNKFAKTICALQLNVWPFIKGRRLTTSSHLNIRIAVCGASGGVGQPLSLLLKMSPHVKELALYDIKNCKGVAADLHHINTKAKIAQFGKISLLPDALKEKDIIVVSAGKAREKGMTRADLFKYNAGVIKEVTDVMSKESPKAMLCIITNPVNSLVPVAASILMKAKVFDPRKLFGITTLDCVRASTFAAELMCYDPTKLTVPVIGGHSGTTIVPIFSQSSMPIELPKDKMLALVHRVQFGGNEVLEAKDNKGTATLSTAYASARFIFALCRAIKGEKNIIECAMVHSDLTDALFFASPVVLGPKGVKKNLGYGNLSPDECCLLGTAVKELIKEIETGKQFMEGDVQKKTG